MTVRLNVLHAQRARERVKANGRLHEVMHAPPTPQWWEKYLPQERLSVAGREVKGFVVPHWAAGVILAAVLSVGWTVYSQISDQRDMLIRLDTQLQERDKHELEYRSEFKNQLNVQKVYIDNMTNQLNMIKGLLTPQQMEQLQKSQKMENQ